MSRPGAMLPCGAAGCGGRAQANGAASAAGAWRASTEQPVQLASALLLRRELAEPVTFAAYDDRLKSAARVEGLTVVP